MKDFTAINNPKTKRPYAAGNTDYHKDRVEHKEKEEVVICRIVPFIVAEYPEFLDSPCVLRKDWEIAQVYKNISLLRASN